MLQEQIDHDEYRKEGKLYSTLLLQWYKDEKKATFETYGLCILYKKK